MRLMEIITSASFMIGSTHPQDAERGRKGGEERRKACIFLLYNSSFVYGNHETQPKTQWGQALACW